MTTNEPTPADTLEAKARAAIASDPAFQISAMMQTAFALAWIKGYRAALGKEDA